MSDESGATRAPIPAREHELEQALQALTQDHAHLSVAFTNAAIEHVASSKRMRGTERELRMRIAELERESSYVHARKYNEMDAVADSIVFNLRGETIRDLNETCDGWFSIGSLLMAQFEGIPSPDAPHTKDTVQAFLKGIGPTYFAMRDELAAKEAKVAELEANLARYPDAAALFMLLRELRVGAGVKGSLSGPAEKAFAALDAIQEQDFDKDKVPA